MVPISLCVFRLFGCSYEHAYKSWKELLGQYRLCDPSLIHVLVRRRLVHVAQDIEAYRYEGMSAGDYQLDTSQRHPDCQEVSPLAKLLNINVLIVNLNSLIKEPKAERYHVKILMPEK